MSYKNNPIARFEFWLTRSRFRLLLAIVLTLNFFVYYYVFGNFVWLTASFPNKELITGIIAEKERVNRLLVEECDGPGVSSFRRNEIGPLPANDSLVKPTNSLPALHGAVLTPDEISSLLQASTVRVLVPKKNRTGSGFFIDDQTIVTNRHVVQGASDSEVFIASKMLGAQPIRATILSASTNIQSMSNRPDFALLRISSPIIGVRALTIGDDPRPLQSIVAAGFPALSTRLDSDQTIPNIILTTGEVSVLQPQPDGGTWIVHTAQIAPGSSGGSLVDRCGSLVGVNTRGAIGETMHDGRTLYALSGSTLRKFLSGMGAGYKEVAGSCGSAGK